MVIVGLILYVSLLPEGITDTFISHYDGRDLEIAYAHLNFGVIVIRPAAIFVALAIIIMGCNYSYNYLFKIYFFVYLWLCWASLLHADFLHLQRAGATLL